ncbi:hypothetical protein FACS1894205_3540 [Alphaproteobacteria bacterium]|nr:hypothetical protein FACS1894205_3540 [Alphaproteobacteria bacterium]
MKLIDVYLYNPELKIAWDDFIRMSKNGVFLFERSYMDYHADRFQDFSLMFYIKKQLLAVLPASRHGGEVRSHGGLTYGGMICDSRMTTQAMLQCFEALRLFLAEQNIHKILYKRVPSIYHTYPADEDLYALFRHQAALIRRDVSTCLPQNDRIGFSSRRLRTLKKARQQGLSVRLSRDYEAFFDLLAQVLAERHQVRPVHTSGEMTSLAAAFPENIKLFGAFRGNDLLAGTIVYETPQVAHTQYLANSEDGRRIGALDLVMDYLICDYYLDKPYIDFGISTEEEGRRLNEGLITQKQEFGGRAVVYDFYEWSL